MPCYFIDFRDGDDVVIDTIGSDVPGFEEARDEAIELLPQVAKDRLPDGEHREFVATVRDEAGTQLYRATLTFHGEKLG